MASIGSGLRGPCAVCGLECGLTCAKCSVAFYCGVAHQREHWPQHRKNCACFEVRSSEALGRHLVATRNIKKGTVILKEKALVAYPPIEQGSDGKQNVACPNCCVKVNDMFDLKWACRVCLLPLCSSNCQKTMGAKGLHSAAECKLLAEADLTRRMPGLPPHMLLFPLSVVRSLLLTGKQGKFFRSLVSHSVLESGSVPDMWSFLKLNPCDVSFAMGVLTTNSFEFSSQILKVEACALLEKISFCNHSCLPNARMAPFMREMGDFTAALIAIQDIPAGDLIAVSYEDVYDPNHIRMRELIRFKKFRCRCLRCEDPTECGTNYNSICCSRCQKRGKLSLLVPETSDPSAICRCETCGFQMIASAVNNYIDLVLEKEKSTGLLTSLDPAVHESFLQRHLYPCGLFFKHSWAVVCVKKHLIFKIYGRSPGHLLSEMTIEQLNRKLELSRELLSVVDVLAPGLSMERASVMKEIHQTLVMLAMQTAGSDHQAAQDFVFEADRLLPDIRAILIDPDVQKDVRTLREDLQNVKQSIAFSK